MCAQPSFKYHGDFYIYICFNMYVEIIHHGDIGSRLSGPGRL